jgi:uncharacterized membrane protein
MSISFGEMKGLVGGILLTVTATLLLLVGTWQLLTRLWEHPIILLVASSLGLLAIFIAIGLAVVRASRADAEQVQESQGGHFGTLSVLRFADPYGADRVFLALQGLQERQLITLEDAAVVSWPQGDEKPTTRQVYSAAGAGWGAFWGFLFGLIFFVPFLGAAIGEGTGGLTGALADVGLDDDFIRQVRKKVTPGTSALFALTSGTEAPDQVIDELKNYEFEIISTNIPMEQERQLREAFAQE